MSRARRAAARAIVGAGWAALAVVVGAEIRGPCSQPSVIRDAAAGGGTLAAVAALAWAVTELHTEREAQP